MTLLFPPHHHIHTLTQAMQRVREDEEELAARIAYETKEELKREEEEMSEAKSKLKTFLTGNEVCVCERV